MYKEEPHTKNNIKTTDFTDYTDIVDTYLPNAMCKQRPC